jgi:hypothetical protein
MVLFAWTASTGWLAALLLAAGIGVPYLAGRGARLWPHYWLGFIVFGAALVHAWIPMSAGRIAGYDQSGLWLATAALGLMLWQLGLGLTLRATRGPERTSLRRTHFWTMLGIVVLVIAHVLRNRP